MERLILLWKMRADLIFVEVTSVARERLAYCWKKAIAYRKQQARQQGCVTLLPPCRRAIAENTVVAV